MFQETVRGTDRELPGGGAEKFPQLRGRQHRAFCHGPPVTFTNMKEESVEGDHRRLPNTPAS